MGVGDCMPQGTMDVRIIAIVDVGVAVAIIRDLLAIPCIRWVRKFVIIFCPKHLLHWSKLVYFDRCMPVERWPLVVVYLYDCMGGPTLS